MKGMLITTFILHDRHFLFNNVLFNLQTNKQTIVIGMNIENDDNPCHGFQFNANIDHRCSFHRLNV